MPPSRTDTGAGICNDAHTDAHTDADTDGPGPRRGLRLLRLGILATLAGGGFALARYLPARGVTTCGFKLWTGTACPGCGMTRAMVHLSHGELGESLRSHPLGVVLVAALLWLLAGSVTALLRRDDPVVGLLERRGPGLAMLLAASLVIVWVVRVFLVPEWAPAEQAPPVWIPASGE